MPEGYVNNEMIARELGVEPKDQIMKNIRDYAHQMVNQHLDPSLTYSQQDAMMVTRVQKGLERRFPAYFRDFTLGYEAKQKRMEVAMCFVKRKLGAIRSGTNTPEVPSTPSRRSERISTLNDGGETGRRANTQASGSRSNVRATPANARTTSTASVASTSRAGNQAPIQTSGPSEARACREAEIKAFLDSCVPPMTSHLEAFIEFGCRNDGFLDGMAGWSEDYLDTALRRIIKEGGEKGKGTGEVTEMDLLVLKRHLRERGQ